MQIESVALNKIIPYIRNPRKNENAVEKVASSIQEFGFRQPIVVDAENVIIAGHTRFEAAKRLGLDVVPIHVADGLTEQQAKAYRIADNRVSQEAEWDYDLLKLELEEIENPEMTGFDEDELNGILAEVGEGLTDPDEVPEVPVEPVTVSGDLWELGDHRLLCGDATKAEDVERLMDGKNVDITIASPPYNIGKTTRGNLYINDLDNKSNEDYLSFLSITSQLSLDHSRFVFWNIQLLESNKISLIDFQTLRRNEIKDVLIWNKKQYPPHINQGTFGTKWEYVFVFSKDNKSRQFPASWQGKYPNVIETENASQNEFAGNHKATFPVSFPLWIIEKMDFSRSVYDCFIGTGSTLIACQKTGRKCYGMEIDPQYCDVIITRWSDFTGKDDLLLNGKPFKWSERQIKKAA